MSRTRVAREMILLGVIAIAIASSAVVAVAAPAPPGKKVKPDLYVQSFTAVRTGSTPSADQVRLKVSVGIRASAAASAGPFKIKVEYRQAPTLSSRRTRGRVRKSGWTALPEAGVAGMTVNPASRRVPLASRMFNTMVPSGKTYEFRAIVDSMHQVDEANETNNTATTTYEASICSETGVDLALTRMRLQRLPDGDLRVDVWVENQCQDDCVANIIALISAVDGSAAGSHPLVDQPILTRVDGNSEVGPVGATVPARMAGRTLTYKVEIQTLGGDCPEATTANNSCTGTIRSGDATKTVNCSVQWDH